MSLRGSLWGLITLGDFSQKHASRERGPEGFKDSLSGSRTEIDSESTLFCLLSHIHSASEISQTQSLFSLSKPFSLEVGSA